MDSISILKSREKITSQCSIDHVPLVKLEGGTNWEAMRKSKPGSPETSQASRCFDTGLDSAVRDDNRKNKPQNSPEKHTEKNSILLGEK